MPKQTRPVPFAAIESRIHLIRETKVMLDADLAELYGVATKNLNKAVTRNRERFPEDFMFRLDAQEFAGLRLRFETSKSRGGRRYLPHAFTQEGIAMLSSVLRSPRAVAVNVEIMRAFVRMRRMLLSVDELARKVEALERKAVAHDQDLQAVFKALKQLIAPRTPLAARLGFMRGQRNRPRNQAADGQAPKPPDALPGGQRDRAPTE